MKVIFKGKFDGNTENLPHSEHIPGAVKFKEFDDPKALSRFANILGFAITFILCVILFLFTNGITVGKIIQIIAGAGLSQLIILPHEFLHAICFKNQSYIYTDLKHGLAFVVGTETMSKSRFVFMSLLPNIIFGVIPYLIFLLDNNLIILGIFGAVSTGMGTGDYYNVFNALTQMPKGAKTYLYCFNSYWYMPEKN